MVSTRAHRRQVEFVCEQGVSQRRPCALKSIARSALRYQSKLAGQNAPIVAAMHELSAWQHPRYDYRRPQVFLSRREHAISAHIDRGKPWQNGSNESYIGKFRDECLIPQWIQGRQPMDR